MRAQLEPSALRCPLPAFTLQILVENAIRHGVARLPQGGAIDVTAKRTGGALELVVANDLPAGPAPRQAAGLGQTTLTSATGPTT